MVLNTELNEYLLLMEEDFSLLNVIWYHLLELEEFPQRPAYSGPTTGCIPQRFLFLTNNYLSNTFYDSLISEYRYGK